ncbi:MAG: VRR-NUC domain-containing protein, partial [Thalassolituus sp.]
MPESELFQQRVSPADLAVTYYLDNFESLLSEVYALYGDLLSDEEVSFYRDFKALSEPARCLYVRMLSRKGDWFRSDKLSYSEIPDINAAATELERSRFIEIFSLQSKMPFPENTEYAITCLALFTKPELLAALKDHPLNLNLKEAKGLSKDALVARLISEFKDGTYRDISDWAQYLPECDLYSVFGSEETETYRLLFFGNLYQDMTDFVLRDLGIYQYEDYPLDKQSRWCQNREQLEAHRSYYNARQALGDLRDASSEELLQAAESIPDTYDPLLKRKCYRFINDIARQLERLKSNDMALTVYEKSARHPARERRLRVLINHGRDDEAEALAGSMLDSPWSEEERQFLIDFIPRKLKFATSLCQRIEEHLSPVTTDVLTMPAENRLELGVERAVVTELEKQGDQLIYCENLLIPGVFGLVFWPAIFAPVAGAFFHPFQFAPADLNDEAFVVSREMEIAQCFKVLESQQALTDHVLETFLSKSGRTNPFVHWGFLSEEIIRLAISRIPLDHWKACFEFLLKDLRHHRAGLPDLIRFPEEGGYELIEVKGPGDTLQKNQKAWLAEFA